MMDQKYLRYRAARISKNTGIPVDEALVIAKQEMEVDRLAQRNSMIERSRTATKKLTQKLKRRNKRTIYVIGGKVVGSIVTGGLPSLGKR